ncbi:hypothetical protein V3C99_014587, partial [Haemonchus contortus]
MSSEFSHPIPMSSESSHTIPMSSESSHTIPMSSGSSEPKPTFGYDPYNDPFKYPCSCAIPPVLEHTPPQPLTDFTPYLPDWMYPNGAEDQPFEITEQVLEAIERNNRIADQLSPVLKYMEKMKKMRSKPPPRRKFSLAQGYPWVDRWTPKTQKPSTSGTQKKQAPK